MKIYKTKTEFFKMSTQTRKRMFCEMFVSEFGGIIQSPTPASDSRNAIIHPIFGRVHVQIQQAKRLFVTNNKNPNAEWIHDFDMDLYVFPGTSKKQVSVALLDLTNPDIRDLYTNRPTSQDLVSNAIRVFHIDTE